MSKHEPHQEQHEQGEGAAERQSESESPRIWIGSLADYNAGRLHGDWVDAAVDDDALIEAARAIIATSKEPGAEEWGIFDYDGFGSFRVAEYETLNIVANVARGIAEHGSAFAAWAQLHDAEPDMLNNFEAAYCGAYDSRGAWADSMLEDFNLETALDGTMPRWLQRYVTFDREGLARDLELGGEVWVEENQSGGIWVFDARA